MAAKTHALYTWLSQPSVVTLCGMVDSDTLRVTRERPRMTCQRCVHVYDKHDSRHTTIATSDNCPICIGNSGKKET